MKTKFDFKKKFFGCLSFIKKLWGAGALNKVLMSCLGGALVLLLVLLIASGGAKKSDMIADNSDDARGSGLNVVKQENRVVDSRDIVIPEPKKETSREVTQVTEVSGEPEKQPEFKMLSESALTGLTDNVVDTKVEPAVRINNFVLETVQSAGSNTASSASNTVARTSNSSSYADYGLTNVAYSPYNMYDTNVNGGVGYVGNNGFSQTDYYLPAGEVGKLVIPSIKLNARVNSTPTLLDYGSNTNIPGLGNGIGHYPNTAWVDGTVGLAAHNHTYFKNLDKVKIGDDVTYTINGLTRTYRIVNKQYVTDDAWGVFMGDGANKLVMTTCERNVFHGRLAVTAVQVGENGSFTGGSNIIDYTGYPGITPYANAFETAAKPGQDDSRGANGHQNDIVDGNTPKIQDEYQDVGHNNWLDVFTGTY